MNRAPGTAFRCCGVALLWLILSSLSIGDQPGLPVPGQGTLGPVPPEGVDRKGVLLGEAALERATIIPGVPAYLWRRGNGPTAAAMILAYYDSIGHPELLPGDAAVQTKEIDQAIASEAHYEDYGLPLDAPPTLLPDRSERSESERHPDNCLADACKTSQSLYGNFYGWTWDAGLRSGIAEFVRSRGKSNATVSTYSFLKIARETVRNEILNRRPLIVLADADADGSADIFVPVVGLASENGVDYYGCYTSWDREIHWFGYRSAAPGIAWGIQSVSTIALYHGVFPPAGFRIERLVNNYLFFKEYIHRLTWEANPENVSRIVLYKIYRKAGSEPDESFGLLAEFDASVSSYDDRGLRKDAAFTYRITAVDEFGHESPPAVAGTGR
ncbi:MAG: hypothetical protein ACYDH0_04165 [Candidatus Aminicenantales bacterium]